MGNGMNKILQGLYLGNFRDSRDVNQLSENKITHILSVHDNAKPMHMDKIYLCLPVSDVPTQDLAQYFTVCNDFIHKARLEGGNVLVHCLAGVSRSVTIVVAYVMTVTNLGYSDALDAVRSSRRCASPNFGFRRQLVEFQYERLVQERSRLITKFGPSKFNDQADSEELLRTWKQSEVVMDSIRQSPGWFMMGNNSADSLGGVDGAGLQPSSVQEDSVEPIANHLSTDGGCTSACESDPANRQASESRENSASTCGVQDSSVSTTTIGQTSTRDDDVQNDGVAVVPCEDGPTQSVDPSEASVACLVTGVQECSVIDQESLPSASEH